MRPSILTVVWLAVSACGYPESQAKLGSCFAAASDDPEVVGETERTELRRVRIAGDDETTDPPEAFATCSRGMPVFAELIDDTGEHVWLALEAERESKELVPRNILALIEPDATLTVRQRRGWNTSDSVFISNGDQPVLLMQSAEVLDGDHGPLRVEDKGASALPALGSCGTSTAHALKFTDDNGEHSANIGETRELIVGGVEWLGTNVFSIEFDWQNCTDGPFPENQATWLAHDNSL